MNVVAAFPPALRAVRAAEWRPRRLADALSYAEVPPGEVSYAEVFASCEEASGAALALAFALDCGGNGTASAHDQRPWLWVQDREALRRGGRPYRPGLPRSLRHRLIHVAARNAQDALFALEEGLRCRDLAFVIGEIAGNPRALSLTASRRLSLVVERHRVPLWLVRMDAERDLSAARQRWQVRAAASPPPRWNPQAPGVPSWQAELFRARAHPPGAWLLRDRDGLVVERAEQGAATVLRQAQSGPTRADMPDPRQASTRSA